MNSRSLKIILAALVMALFVLCCGFYKITCDKKAKRLYKQGMEFFLDGNYSDAFYNFKEIKSVSSLYKYALLKQFQSANYLSDKKTAYQKLNELSKLDTDPNLRPYILYNEALLGQELNELNNNQLYRKFKYVYDIFPNSDFAPASAYKVAKLSEEKDFEVAKEMYLEYIDYAPVGKYALSSLDSLDKEDIKYSLSETQLIADTYFQNAKYDKALKYYKKLPFSDNWYKISKCYKALNDKTQEKDTIIKGLNIKHSAVDEKDVYNAIDRLILITKADKIQTLQNLYTKYPFSYIYPTVTYKLAEACVSIRSIKLYESIFKNFPNSIWASNSLWEVFWYNYTQKRYKVCEGYAKLHMLNYPDSQDAPRVAYWYARVLLKEKKILNARDIFYKVINEYPLSYYAFLSARQLKLSKAKKMIVKKPIANYKIDNLKKYFFKDKFLLMLANNNDWDTIDDLKIDDEYIKSYIAYKKNLPTKSVNIAKKAFLDNKKDKINFTDNELKLIYPIYYEDIINENAKAQNQSPYLFLSLIREESHFDKSAKSPAGAIGLTQLMPDTANFILKTKINKNDLSDEEKNIQIGLKYFKYLVNNFNENEFLAILAYNAGPGNVNKWLNDSSVISDDFDEFVENIPYLETKNYIKKILSTYWVYLNIYSPKNI